MSDPTAVYVLVSIVAGAIGCVIGAISARKTACEEFQEELDKHTLSGRCSYYERQP